MTTHTRGGVITAPQTLKEDRSARLILTYGNQRPCSAGGKPWLAIAVLLAYDILKMAY